MLVNDNLKVLIIFAQNLVVLFSDFNSGVTDRRTDGRTHPLVEMRKQKGEREKCKGKNKRRRIVGKGKNQAHGKSFFGGRRRVALQCEKPKIVCPEFSYIRTRKTKYQERS